MAYEEIADLDCSTTVALGGINKKTGKPNPKQVEGYYIGSRQVPSQKSKTGFAQLHVFQTKTGNIGVWGKTNLDQKLGSAKGGLMTKVSFVGMVPTKNNPMYKYAVAQDPTNFIDVSSLTPSTGEGGGEESYEETTTDTGGYAGTDEPEQEAFEEEPVTDEAAYAPPTRPARPALAPDAARTAKVQAALAQRKRA